MVKFTRYGRPLWSGIYIESAPIKINGEAIELSYSYTGYSQKYLLYAKKWMLRLENQIFEKTLTIELVSDQANWNYLFQ